MKPEDAYKLICKDFGFRPYVKLCKDFGDFYAFFLTRKKDDELVGGRMTAVNKSTKKIFEYNLMDSRYDYSKAKTIPFNGD